MDHLRNVGVQKINTLVDWNDSKLINFFSANQFSPSKTINLERQFWCRWGIGDDIHTRTQGKRKGATLHIQHLAISSLSLSVRHSMRRVISLFSKMLSNSFLHSSSFSNTWRLSENSNFFSNRGMRKKLPQVYSWYSEDNFLSMTKSWGKRAFSDRLLVTLKQITSQ